MASTLGLSGEKDVEVGGRVEMSVGSIVPQAVSNESSEASKYLGRDPIDPDTEKKLVRKLDTRILPWIMLLYFTSYLDRNNIGNARNIGLADDLHLSDSEYQNISSVFFVATVVFTTIGGLGLKLVKPSTWLSICLIGWGCMATIQAGATNAPGLAAIRFFLGMFEASFAPGCAFYLSFWYLRTELSLRIAAYAGTSALAGVVGGLISYGFGVAKHLAIPAWQALFITEGFPTIIVGVITYFYLPDRPEAGRHRWFSEEEQAVLLDRRTRYVDNVEKGVVWRQALGCLLDYRLYVFTLVYAGPDITLAVTSIFLPTIIGELGYTAAVADLLTAPVYASAYCSLICMAWFSDRIQKRGPIVACGCATAGLGYILLCFVKGAGAKYGCTFLVAIGAYVSFPIVLAWILSTFAADTKGGMGVSMVIAMSHAVGIAASYMFPDGDAPRYLTGNVAAGSLSFASSITALVVIFLLWHENRRRDRKYGRPERNAPVQMTGLADNAQDYRYVL